MKTRVTIGALAALLVIAGCGSKEEPTAASSTTPAATGSSSSAPAAASLAAYEVGSKKKGDKAVCIVCNVKEGSTEEEEVKETLDYQGKLYVFCNEAEKADFISDPKKFAAK